MLEYLFMFPVAVVISTVAMTLGVGVASLFTPLLYLLLDIPASVAVGTGLLLEVFGFGTGLLGFIREGLIDYDVGMYLMAFTVPAAILGAFTTQFTADWMVLTGLVFLFATLGYILLDPGNVLTVKNFTEHERCHKDTSDCWDPPASTPLIIFCAVLGGLFDGMISSGVGEMNDFILFEEYRMHGPIAAGTSVFVATVTVFVGFATHAYSFFTEHIAVLPTIFYVAISTVPGVLLGSELGVKLSSSVGDEERQRYIGMLYIILAVFTATILVLT